MAILDLKLTFEDKIDLTEWSCQCQSHNSPGLKVPKREIFDRSDFPDFYTIKSSWVGDLLVKILIYYFNF